VQGAADRHSEDPYGKRATAASASSSCGNHETSGTTSP
jgi:hypothetical protein